MIFRAIALFTLLAILLTACNLSLAEDITPPPGYVSPTAAPTLGPLFPAQAANLENGAAIFVEKCRPCHGATGLGDGAMGQQLPVPVAALGLPQTAQKASPASWYTVVTQGRMDRSMPPFLSLSEQERWDVVAYALSLHATPQMLAQGKSLFEANCATCADLFTDQARMAALSENDLIHLIQKGDGTIPAFGAKLDQTELDSVAAYLRSLTFASAAPPAPPTVVPVPATPSAAESGTPVPPGESGYPNPTAGTPTTPPATATLDGTAQAQAAAGTVVVPTLSGAVHGSITFAGGTLPSGLTVTLRGYDHAQNASGTATGPKEILTLTATPAADGSLLFENVELVKDRLLVVEAEYKGLVYQSDFAAVAAGASEVTLSPIALYDTSTDINLLTVTQSHVFLEIANGALQVIEFLTLNNSTQASILVPVVDNQMALVKMPGGMTNLGFDAQQGAAKTVLATDSNNFALPPSTKSYGLVAGFEMPYTDSAEIQLPFVLGMDSGSVLVPVGVKLEGAGLVDMGTQDIGSGSIYQAYRFGAIKPGDILSLKLSGMPQATPGGTSAPAETQSNQPLIIGAGMLGLALIALGAWLYLRDRKRAGQDTEEDGDSAEFEDSESVLDAIIALDDLHRAGKLPDEAYQKRRAELKEQLKRKS